MCVNLDAFSSHTSLQILPTVSCRTCTDLLLLLALVWEVAGLRPSDASPKLFAGAGAPLTEQSPDLWVKTPQERPGAGLQHRTGLGSAWGQGVHHPRAGHPRRVTPSFPFPFEFRPPATQERPRWDAEPPPASKNAVAEDPSVSCLARGRPPFPASADGGFPHRPAAPVRQAPHPPGRPGSGPGWGRDAGAGGEIPGDAVSGGRHRPGPPRPAIKGGERHRAATGAATRG